MKCFVLDMDGTVYLGEKAIPGAVEFISELNRRGIKYRFLIKESQCFFQKDCTVFIKIT